MQVVYSVLGGDLRQFTLPKAEEHVLPGVVWGAFDELMTPAFWRIQAWQHEALGTYEHLNLGRTLLEEVAACLLGGYGMPAELGLAAYARLRDRGLLFATSSATTLEQALLEPFQYRGTLRTYRFPRQKARYLAACLSQLDCFVEPADDVALRDTLATLPGIGLKTASWIVRNYRASNEVAIIDVHILRAGRHIGLFKPGWTPTNAYRGLETAFLSLANAMNTPASLLDSLVWDHMRRMPVRRAAQPNGIGQSNMHQLPFEFPEAGQAPGIN